MKETIILASRSKGRDEMLTEIGLPHICIPTETDETTPWTDPLKEIEALAVKKALQSHLDNRHRSEKWIAAADTVVLLDGKPIGKPGDITEAESFLRRLSGREHLVLSGVAFMNRSTGQILSDSDTTSVKMAPLSEEEIKWYLSTGEWEGAAGAYRIQHKGALLIEKINGSYSNVIGLPLRKFFTIIQKNYYPVGP